MYLHGSFLSKRGETVTVRILTNGDRSKDVEIGDEASGVFFSADPVSVDTSVNDTFDHLLRSRASIRLLTRDFIGELFCPSCTDAVVNIHKGGRCVFAGYVEPQAYSQGYNEVYDELEISCIDALSALQNLKYGYVGSLGVDYEALKASAKQRTFGDIARDILGDIRKGLDIEGEGSKVYYDGSKSLTADSDRYGIFDSLAISELLFLGDEEDDAWTQSEALEEMLKYLNLHIAQDGLTFYVFSWESVKDGKPLAWRSLDEGSYMAEGRAVVSLSVDNAASNDTSISVGETHNRILLTCDVKSIESLIKSPLDEDELTSPYSGRQKYMTEYSADGEGQQAYDAFWNMTHGKAADYSGASITDWYVQVMSNPSWKFPEGGKGADIVDKYCQGNADQQTLPNMFPQKPCCAIISMGSVDMNADRKDNSPTSKIEMSSSLVLSVNGNRKDTAAEAYPSEQSLLANAPCAVYTCATSGAVYSPSDDGATNYLVISGKISLNPIVEITHTYEDLTTKAWDLSLEVWHKTVPCNNNKDGRYYTQKYYKAATPFDKPVVDKDTTQGLTPYTDNCQREYEFKYSAIGDGSDTVSKVAVLACMLVIGDKCLVETGTAGQPSDFEWREYKSRESCADDDEYYGQCFTIGFDPKIGDSLIGTEFDIQNNIDFTMGLDTEGTAIPMRRSDKLSGEVRFMILGPVNTLWDDVTRRHPTWFRTTKWGSTSVPLLAHVGNIMVKDFEIKVHSDNGMISNAGDNDIVYMSDTKERFVNPKDDIELRISSALTIEECRQLGVACTVSLSTPLDTESGEGLLTVYDRNKAVQAKPEQLYVDSYYTECHKPRVRMEHKIDDTDEARLFNLYRHPAMADKRFYVLGISRNLREGYAQLMMKEVWND